MNFSKNKSLKSYFKKASIASLVYLVVLGAVSPPQAEAALTRTGIDIIFVSATVALVGFLIWLSYDLVLSRNYFAESRNYRMSKILQIAVAVLIAAVIAAITIAVTLVVATVVYFQTGGTF